MILADMDSGSGQVTNDWFERMYEDVDKAEILFTAIGIVTSDPASVESVLAWARTSRNGGLDRKPGRALFRVHGSAAREGGHDGGSGCFLI